QRRRAWPARTGREARPVCSSIGGGLRTGSAGAGAPAALCFGVNRYESILLLEFQPSQVRAEIESPSVEIKTGLFGGRDDGRRYPLHEFLALLCRCPKLIKHCYPRPYFLLELYQVAVESLQRLLRGQKESTIGSPGVAEEFCNPFRRQSPGPGFSIDARARQPVAICCLRLMLLLPDLE